MCISLSRRTGVGETGCRDGQREDRGEDGGVRRHSEGRYCTRRTPRRGPHGTGMPRRRHDGPPRGYQGILQYD